MAKQKPSNEPESATNRALSQAVACALIGAVVDAVLMRSAEPWARYAAPFGGLAVAAIMVRNPNRNRYAARGPLATLSAVALAAFFGVWIAPIAGWHTRFVSAFCGFLYAAGLPESLDAIDLPRRKTAFAILFGAAIVGGLIAIPRLEHAGSAGWVVTVSAASLLALIQARLMRLLPAPASPRPDVVQPARPRRHRHRVPLRDVTESEHGGSVTG